MVGGSVVSAFILLRVLEERRVTLNKAKGRMFKSVGWTWNPIHGCIHECKYCWAKSLRERWGKSFEVGFREEFLWDKMPDDGTWIFVGSTGDVFCEAVPKGWLLQLLLKIAYDEKDNKFLLQTKNPSRFLELEEEFDTFKEKIILGTTIETNRETPWSKAPPTWLRHQALRSMKNKGFKTFLSLEPLADFDLNVLKLMIGDIQPEAIELGLENYTSFLPKPPAEKTVNLLNWLKINGFTYVLKENLRHLES